LIFLFPKSWVTDITYTRTHEGWLYLAVVVDLFSRQVVGWSMGSRIDTGLVLDALNMALWRRRPTESVVVHSDQGCQFTGQAWQICLRERIRRQNYLTRDDARADVFNDIEMFYNPKRRHSTVAGLSPAQFEQRHFQRLAGL
jgi:putative transposase